MDRRHFVAGLLGAAGGGTGLTRRSFAATADVPDDDSIALDHDTTLLRIAGDDVSTSGIIPMIAANFLHAQGAAEIRVSSAEAPWTSKVRGRLLSGAHLSILIRASTTLDGYERLVAGETDIWLAGYSATREQIGKLSAKGDVAYKFLARYALALMVHPSNPIGTLSYRQVADIFAGSITDWSEVGGSPGPIHLYGRGYGSASETTFLGLLYGRALEIPAMHLMPLFVDMQRAMASDPSAIGCVALDFKQGLKPVPLTIRGRITSRPTAYGLRTGDYPLANAITMYRFAKPGRDFGADLFREAQSARSDYLLSVAGFEGSDPRLLLPELFPPIELDANYVRLDPNGLRVSTTIRFPADSTELDTAAHEDVHNLAQYLRRLSVANEQLVHICYSEDTGDAAKNREISRQLGRVFAAALRGNYFTPGILLARGAALMLGNDSTPASRRLNRRVETWIRP